MDQHGEIEQDRRGAIVAANLLYTARVAAAGSLGVKAAFGLLPPDRLNPQNILFICADRGVPMVLAHLLLLAAALTLALGLASRLSAAACLLVLVWILWHCGQMADGRTTLVFVTLIMLLALVSSHGGGRFALDGGSGPRRFAGWR